MELSERLEFLIEIASAIWPESHKDDFAPPPPQLLCRAEPRYPPSVASRQRASTQGAA